MASPESRDVQLVARTACTKLHDAEVYAVLTLPDWQAGERRVVCYVMDLGIPLDPRQ